MPLHQCDIANCIHPSVRRSGSCVMCKRHLCATHSRAPHHTCPRWEVNEEAWRTATSAAEMDEITTLLSLVNADALCSRASLLRGGKTCSLKGLSCEPEESLILTRMGGMNYHVTIDFEDGVSWICRIPRLHAGTAPAELRRRILLSEAATLRFLADAGIPVPRVYDYEVSRIPTTIGVNYIMMSKLEGKPLDWYDKDEHSKAKVLNQLADIFVKLRACRFDSIGSLLHPQKLSIGPLVAESTTDIRDGTLHLLGPFMSSLEYRLAWIERQLDLICSGEAYSTSGVDAYLVHRSLKDYLTRYSVLNSGGQPPFYLKHMDDKGDHILVDDEDNITGIIDWEWAQTTSEGEAFSAPLFLLDVGAYYDGQNELSEDEKMFSEILKEKGRDDLASFVSNGRIHHRLTHCLAGDIDDKESFPNLFAGLLAALEGRSPDDPSKIWKEWKEIAMDKYRDEERLKQLLIKYSA
ncbi:hypothetical protein GLOTRDRAFT_79352 [Gloeophyllum trabeum ATCC 11539]|uniref:Aminoglycoside phosphotransferase domain-containing protein n=1 Tax=Gloeophyllum trabeum (strain ATCC 11539 / FP-39264 / Madison 617) TaxID=670483 RepID=S7PZY8_GLOTA|nr:uncharacterized protein GLOTRDRAFT_79352 [Gloeophyllum trabeum ATCC 11539]EPQ53246.1 hypothetical protein GLOTRDRAFT_79352 [Gloeophyllum trabeum ATCC 11539]